MIEIKFPDKKIINFPTNEVLERTFMRSGPKLTRTSKAKMRGPKTGQFYNINGRLHRASAPGEAPAELTGSLSKTVRNQTSGSDLLFGAGKKKFITYAKFLELGTAKMKERPFIFVSIKENFKNIENDVTKAIKDSIK